MLLDVKTGEYTDLATGKVMNYPNWLSLRVNSIAIRRIDCPPLLTWAPSTSLLFNVKVDLCRGAVPGYFLAIQFHF
jgi:hypothetical protein